MLYLSSNYTPVGIFLVNRNIKKKHLSFWLLWQESYSTFYTTVPDNLIAHELFSEFLTYDTCTIGVRIV